MRTLTHDVLRGLLGRVQRDHDFGQFSQDMQLVSVTNSVERLAKQQGHITPNGNLTREEQHFVVQALWELVIQGILVPNNATSGREGWPWISFTDYGEKAILAERPTPYDPTEYLAQFSATSTDSIVRFYVEEALGCFRANRHTACAVMLGVASERVFDLLLECFVGALASPQEQRTLRQRTQGRLVKSRYEEMVKHLSPKKDQLPQPLRENLDTCLISIFNLIRQQRNDSGHPTGRAITRDEAYALLYVLPHYHEQMAGLIGYLKETPNSLI